MDLLPYEPPGLFGREPERNAFVELHNGVVAALEAPGDFGTADADRIGRQRGVDLRQAFFAERLVLYGRLFDEARSATGPDAHALRLLAAAAETLALTTSDLAPIHEHVYGDAVATVLEDDRLSVDERLHLYALQTALGLSSDRAEGLYHAPARARVLRIIAGALADGEMPPEQVQEVAAAAEALAVPIDAALAAMIDTAVGRWTARMGPLPVLDAPIVPMRSGETAHADVAVQWAQMRGDDLRDAFAGRLSRDETRQQRLFPTVLFTHAPRASRLVVTNQRLVLVRVGRPALDVPLASIRETVAFSDGLLLQVGAASRRFLFELYDDAQAMSTLLARLAPSREMPGAAAWWRPLADAAEADDLAASSFGWSLPGRVRTERARVVLCDATGEVHIGIPRVTRVSQLDSALAIEIDGLAGWIVDCRVRADGDALYAWIARQIEHR